MAGLYLNPPENAVVLCIDEKPHIQVLERAQGWLRLPNGKALNGFSHCYKRHGASTLFAALEVSTGHVQVAHSCAPPAQGVPGLHERRGGSASGHRTARHSG